MLPLRMSKLLPFKMLRVPRACQSRWNFGIDLNLLPICRLH